MAAQRLAKVGFICSQPTRRLVEWSLADSINISQRLPADLAAWDLQCPLMSLPARSALYRTVFQSMSPTWPRQRRRRRTGVNG